MKIITIQERRPRRGTGSTIHDVSAGELTCNNFGFVVSERMEDSRQERRSCVDQGEGNNRVGNPGSLYAVCRKNEVDESTKRGIPAGREPARVAASAPYLSCVINCKDRSQNDISRACGVHIITIITGCKRLVRSLKSEIKR